MLDFQIDRDEKVINLRTAIAALNYILARKSDCLEASENLPKLEAELAKRILWLRQRG